MIPETDDPIKSQLLRKAAQQREELQSDVQQLTERTEKIITNALLVGGALALTYLLVRGVTGSRKKKNKTKAHVRKNESVISDQEDDSDDRDNPVMEAVTKIGAALAAQASVVLLNLAKEKLIEYLEERVQRQSDEHTK
jgi:FtsZ-interacting cell division protein ZipA